MDSDVNIHLTGVTPSTGSFSLGIQTGLAASIAGGTAFIFYITDSGATGVATGYTLTEVDSTNLPGFYVFLPSATDINRGTRWVQFIFQFRSGGTKTNSSIRFLKNFFESGADSILTRTSVEASYVAPGASPNLSQFMHLILALLTNFSLSGTTMTLKKLDGSTTAGTCTIDSSSFPTTIARST